MVKYYDSILPDHQSWILDQPVFFVASAPLLGKHVNVSPKGLPASSLAILGPNEVAYVDATGSGNETISHARENGRLTVMLCSFGPTPRILRLFCEASVLEWDEPRFHALVSRMGLTDRSLEGARAVLHLHVFKAQTSCGYGVPRLALTTASGEPKPYLQDRETMGHWANNKIEKNLLHSYQRDNNDTSIDGLPGMRVAMRDRGGNALVVEGKIWACQHRRALEIFGAMLLGGLIAIVGLWALNYLEFTFPEIH